MNDLNSNHNNHQPNQHPPLKKVYSIIDRPLNILGAAAETQAFLQFENFQSKTDRNEKAIAFSNFLQSVRELFKVEEGIESVTKSAKGYRK